MAWRNRADRWEKDTTDPQELIAHAESIENGNVPAVRAAALLREAAVMMNTFLCVRDERAAELKRLYALEASRPPEGAVRAQGPDDDWEERGAADALRAQTIEECAKIADRLRAYDLGSEKNYGKAIRALAIPHPAEGVRELTEYHGEIGTKN